MNYLLFGHFLELLHISFVHFGKLVRCHLNFSELFSKFEKGGPHEVSIIILILLYNFAILFYFELTKIFSSTSQ